MSVRIELSDDEALVLFEWIAQQEEAKEAQGGEDISAETKVFWTMEAQLEKDLREPFDPRYQQLLENARQRIRNR